MIIDHPVYDLFLMKGWLFAVEFGSCGGTSLRFLRKREPCSYQNSVTSLIIIRDRDEVRGGEHLFPSTRFPCPLLLLLCECSSRFSSSRAVEFTFSSRSRGFCCAHLRCFYVSHAPVEFLPPEQPTSVQAVRLISQHVSRFLRGLQDVQTLPRRSSRNPHWLSNAGTSVVSSVESAPF